MVGLATTIRRARWRCFEKVVSTKTSPIIAVWYVHYMACYGKAAKRIFETAFNIETVGTWDVGSTPKVWRHGHLFKRTFIKISRSTSSFFFFSNLSICVSIFSPDSFSECKFAGFQGLERNRKISSPRGYALNRNWLADICHNLESSASGADVQKVG